MYIATATYQTCTQVKYELSHLDIFHIIFFSQTQFDYLPLTPQKFSLETQIWFDCVMFRVVSFPTNQRALLLMRSRTFQLRAVFASIASACLLSRSTKKTTGTPPPSSSPSFPAKWSQAWSRSKETRRSLRRRQCCVRCRRREVAITRTCARSETGQSPTTVCRNLCWWMLLLFDWCCFY